MKKELFLQVYRTLYKEMKNKGRVIHPCYEPIIKLLLKKKRYASVFQSLSHHFLHQWKDEKQSWVLTNFYKEYNEWINQENTYSESTHTYITLVFTFPDGRISMIISFDLLQTFIPQPFTIQILVAFPVRFNNEFGEDFKLSTKRYSVAPFLFRPQEL